MAAVTEFWANKESMLNNAFKKKHKALRQSISLALPTTHQGVEKQMREDLYLEGVRITQALEELQGMRDLVDSMARGEVPVPPGSAWALVPAIWGKPTRRDRDEEDITEGTRSPS